MTRRKLDLLAHQGMRAVKPSEFVDLAAWCRDWCVNTGDARFCLVGEALRQISDDFGEQGLPTFVVEELDGILRRGLPLVLSAQDPASGAQEALNLLHELGTIDPWQDTTRIDDALNES